MTGTDFANDILDEWNMGAAGSPGKLVSDRGMTPLMSALARLNYNFLGRYLLTGSYRYDCSGKFAPGHRGFHAWSAAAAWRLSDEAFIKRLDFFEMLKLRFSCGTSGNQGIGPYATHSRMVPLRYTIDGKLVIGFGDDEWAPARNPYVRWEGTLQFNLGLDIAILRNRISLTVDLYQKTTVMRKGEGRNEGLLQEKPLPPSTGFRKITTNSGGIRNRGLEITANFLAIDHRDFSWKINGNISFNRNQIRGLDEDQFSELVWGMESTFLRRNHQPIGILWGYREEGYFDNEAEVRAHPMYKNESDAKIRSMIGQVKYRDINGDDKIDNSDKEIIGDTNPSFTYGITNTFTYKNFTLSFFLQGTQGNDILNVNLRPYDMANSRNMPRFIYDGRWTPQNKKNATSPRADNTYTRSMKPSNRYVEDGSYLRMKNINLSYRFVKPLKHIEAVNLSLGINNLFTVTKYRWYDPDVNTFGGDPSRRGVDMASYPSARTFNFGIQVTF